MPYRVPEEETDRCHECRVKLELHDRSVRRGYWIWCVSCYERVRAAAGARRT
jgi:hypothetical protein